MGNGMERIWNFFENMNEYVYVADADTHELVYMNKKILMGYIQKKNLPAKNVMNCFRIQACPVRSAIMMNCRRDSLRSGGILTRF